MDYSILLMYPRAADLSYGNDGWDVISDYTTNLEDTLAPLNKWCQELSR